MQKAENGKLHTPQSKMRHLLFGTPLACVTVATLELAKLVAWQVL